MRRPGLLQRCLQIRACRLLAVLGAYLLLLQSAGLPLLLAEGPASCCCAHREADHKCNCSACTHARELESGQPQLKTCGATGQPTLAPALDAAEPPSQPLALRASPERAVPEPAPLRDGPPREVVTPPPLALV
jgi:hypothetical protein